MSGNAQETNKWVAFVAYIWILFIVPLVVDSQNEFYRFHANQGLILFILGIVFTVASWVIPYVGWIISLAGWVISLVFMILGMVNAYNEEMKELPIIGNIRILK
ncbi:MAG: hypothetical protein CSA13_00745 [Clostridiales bacterium]|nr:MAG: hypothetical protein CSA13_00745 [Clostridiales bacterium]